MTGKRKTRLARNRISDDRRREIGMAYAAIKRRYRGRPLPAGYMNDLAERFGVSVMMVGRLGREYMRWLEPGQWDDQHSPPAAA